jgi:hypothetical protein
VWRGNIPGHEIEFPMAVVILGGLVTSTLLNLFLLPVLYARFGRSSDAITGRAVAAELETPEPEEVEGAVEEASR